MLLEGFVWQRSEAQGVTRLTKDVTETLEGWTLNWLLRQRRKYLQVELIKGRASYSRKGSNLALNLVCG